MNDYLTESSDQSSRSGAKGRREFLREMACGMAVLASGAITGCRTIGRETVRTVRGAAKIVLPFESGWLFRGRADAPTAGVAVTLPHSVTKLSWQDWTPQSWQQVWLYERNFDLPEEFRGRRIYLNFEGVMVGVAPSINGQSLPPRLGGYLPARYEVTGHLQPAGNRLVVKVDSRWSNVPPDGSPAGPKRVDYLEAGGIHREVRLEALPVNHISDVFVKPAAVLTPDRRLDVKCTIDSSLAVDARELEVELYQDGRRLAVASRVVAAGGPGVQLATVTLRGLDGLQLWDVDDPRLCEVRVTLREDGRVMHVHRVRTGVREARFTVDGLFLNGRRLQIFGLDRHEVYPYAGYAMPPRVKRRDAEILKHDFNCNFVRCSHYPQSPAFLDACDELGLMVWEEVPGWGYIGDAAWQDLLVRDARDMILRDRNRPSVVIWGTRVNESPNEEKLYYRTKAIAKELDGTRQTSGSMVGKTRETWKTKWHEDVFAFDDYHTAPDGSVGILDPVPGVPYMLAETVGQFNYTRGKYFDSYYRRAADIPTQQLQALRHAMAHSKTGADPHNSGAVAWCAFEYSSLVNAYRNVKYPGVADVFRIPKLGAAFYLAQADVTRRVVIEPGFYWDFGPGCPRGPGRAAAIFSNCDRLVVWIGGQRHAELTPDVARYPNLKHAPFFIDLDMEGHDRPELRIDGYAGGELVGSRRFTSDPAGDRLRLQADDTELSGDGVDATRVVMQVVDLHGAPRALGGGRVDFTLTGPADLIGDNPFNLTESGGAGAVWVRTQPSKPGRVVLKAKHESLGASAIEITVKPASAGIRS